MIILLENIKIYAYHGVLPEENKIGANYIVNLKVDALVDKSGKTDDLTDTVNYATLSNIIHQEMKIKSNLLEHVAFRILDKLKEVSPKINQAEIKISKLSPPMPGNVESASVICERKYTAL